MLAQYKLLTYVLLLVSAISLVEVEARPPMGNHRDNGLPKLSDTLSVAKSPFEPITMAPGLPGGRYDEAHPVALSTMEVDAVQSDETSEKRQSTQSVVKLEQKEASSSTRTLEESTGLRAEASSSTRSVVETTTTEQPDETTTTIAAEEAETASNETTTTTAATTLEPATTASAESAPAKEDEKASEATPQPDPEPSSTVSAPSVQGSESEKPEASTESFPKLDGSAGDGNFKGASSLGQNITATTENEQPSTTTGAPTTTTTAAATTITSSPEVEPSSTVVEREHPMETTAITTSALEITTTPEPTTTTSTTTTPPKPTTTAPTTTTTAPTTTTTAPTTTTSTTTTTPPPPTTTVTTTTGAPTTTAPVSSITTAKPVAASVHSVDSSAEEKEKEREKKSSCNHLPTYDSDEIQKVFREETTYKNGTIKGKFTYINFDQRYRLVHYTRLPYGPVKIDLVEELGRPEQAGGSSGSTPSNGNQSTSSTPLSDIPNAVLQLRNLLPTSLFGFPFLGPNSGRLGPISGARDGNDDDRSNMYFYSTDSLSTPNLLTPRVPVSLLPGQRLKQQVPASDSLSADALSQSYLEHSLAANPAPKPQYAISPSQLGSSAASSGELFKPKQSAAVDQYQEALKLHQRQLQYSYPEQQSRSHVYDYFASQSPMLTGPQYQPLPIYQPPVSFSYDQPRTLAHHHHHQINHQAHQPHSHEHYVAPFMFAQPPNANGELNEGSRLRLKVKTSKALHNHDAGAKSAQLRLQSNGLYSPPANSPVQRQHHQPRAQTRQRLGKQNHDLKASTTTTNSHNNLPVVYHVLRSPTGRTFTMPQSNQGYAIAYDQDD